MGLHIKTIELVALGAAIGGNCIPCLDDYSVEVAPCNPTRRATRSVVESHLTS